MLTCTKRKGNAGNRLFQLASLIGLSEKYGHELRLPKGETWDCLQYFDVDIPEFTGRVNRFIVEPNFHHDPDFFEQQLSKKEEVIDICGWLQTEKYFCSKLSFKQSFKNEIWAKHGFSRPTIAISVRRGDFVNNPNYYQLPVKYYIGALLENFPDWRDSDLVFFSDDPEYLKIHFQCLPNAHFPQLSPMEQLCLGSQCDNIIISNSTFSWWMAYLSEAETVIRPLKNLSGKLAQTHSEKDFWPSRWQIFDHEQYKIDLKNTTFCIPVNFDHHDRKQNLDLSVCMLQKDFDTNTIVMEQGSDKFAYHGQWSTYIKSDLKEFHRTKMLNQMAAQANTDYVVLHDADVFIPPMQIIETVHKLDQGADMVYPYDGRFARVPRMDNLRLLEKNLDLGVLKGKYPRMDIKESVGGSVFYNKESFIDGGMENENFIAHAPEDAERYDRFNKLGFGVERVDGRIYHMDHYVGVNSSSTRNPHHDRNFMEIEKVRAMSKDELQAYIETWQWRHPYTGGYYETIIKDAIKSRDEIFKLEPIKRIFKGTETKTRAGMFYGKNGDASVIDVGCGLGEWGKDIDKFGVKKYVGIDHKVPAKKLLIENFIDHDLKKAADFEVNERFDLALCLEVAEHLPGESAGSLVSLLCSLSDYVLFSAAIPGQGGLCHINEQWQTYWEALFNEHGYYASEKPVKDLLKGNANVCYWYRQNIVLYSKHFRGKAENYVDPGMWLNIISQIKQTA